MDNILLKKAEAIQKQAVAYIERTQPVVEEYAKFKSDFAKKAHQVVGALVEKHIVPQSESTALIDKLASDPSSALELALSISRRVGVGSDLGKAASAQAPVSNLDPFEALVMYGDARADVSNFDGVVE